MTRSRGRTIRSSFAGRLRKPAMAILIWITWMGPSTPAAGLKEETSAAFDRYITLTESRMDDDLRSDQFFVIDHLPDEKRKEVYEQLREGMPYIEEMRTQVDNHAIHIPNGLVHHWAGVIFIPKATLSETNAVLQDIDHETEIYKPDVRKAKLIERNGNETKILLQFYNKSIITVVLNAYSDVVVTQIGSSRLQSASRSTRIVEVEDWDGPNEHERTDGNDYGYMWRLNSYWRLEEKDGGVYVQNESITLSRTVPVMLAWLIDPLIKSIPREVMSHTLTNTQRAVERRRDAESKESRSESSR